MIIAGDISPADQIDANQLGDMLELGRTPVREALLRLQVAGIVEIVPKRGVRVVTLSATDITETYQVITAIEVEAVRLLTLSKPGAKDVVLLKEAAQQMTVAAEHDQREDWVLADESFHRALLCLNPNKRLAQVGLTHRDLAQRAHFVALRLLRPEQVKKSAREHKRLIRLIVSGDAKAAVECHQGQRDRGATMLVGVLQQYGLSQI